MYSMLHKDWLYCQKKGVDRNTFHKIHLQLRGIAPLISLNGYNYPCAYLDYMNPSSRRQYVPRKVPINRDGTHTYIVTDDEILFCSSPVEHIFPDEKIIVYPLMKDEDKYRDGYSFPFINSITPYYELRINPKNSGMCPGHCAFCHRETSYREKANSSKKIITVDDILASIISVHGKDSLKQINHVSVITELFGDERRFLDYIDELKSKLSSYSHGRLNLRACAQDVRSSSGLERLAKIVDDEKYSFTLEVFENRDSIMSKYKGIPIEQVKTILVNAKNAGFRYVKLNYIAGIDSIDTFEQHMRDFKAQGIVDMLGLSIFTAFNHEQSLNRNDYAWHAEYYCDIIDIIASLGIALYEPHCFDMGFPEKLVNRCKIFENGQFT